MTYYIFMQEIKRSSHESYFRNKTITDLQAFVAQSNFQD